MTKATELRELAAEALRKSEGAAYLHEAQWFLKLRRVLTEAADALDVPPMVRAQAGDAMKGYRLPKYVRPAKDWP